MPIHHESQGRRAAAILAGAELDQRPGVSGTGFTHQALGASRSSCAARSTRSISLGPGHLRRLRAVVLSKPAAPGPDGYAFTVESLLFKVLAVELAQTEDGRGGIHALVPDGLSNGLFPPYKPHGWSTSLDPGGRV